MFVAREDEIRRIRGMLQDRKAQVGVVYGRRRVGKIFDFYKILTANELIAAAK